MMVSPIVADSTVAEVRAFNRFYTRQIGLLNESAKSRFSLGEGRVLYEIGKRGATSGRDLADTLALDPGYLSRVLQKFATDDLIAVTPSASDRRSNEIRLSQTGEASVEELEQLNDASIEAVLDSVPAVDRAALVDAMATIRTILGDQPARGPVILRPHRIGDLGWMIHRQGILYNRQFGWNIGFESLIASIYNEFQEAPGLPAKELWVAEQNGSIVGSIFVMPSEGLADSAQLRMLYVEPSARGQGVGTVLVNQAVSFARDNGYARMRLWTHTIQEAARRVYAAAGFAVVATIPEHNFGKVMTGEIWELGF
jgi:DNA-binding MarR family transcriptional regulator/GNAT superfamily N-acetyltransferase